MTERVKLILSFMKLRGHLEKDFAEKKLKRAYNRSLKLDDVQSSDNEEVDEEKEKPKAAKRS